MFLQFYFMPDPMETKKKKTGFTIIEMLLMVVIIGVSLAAIIVTLNNGMTYIQKTREKTIAINLAREGIEAMYQIRDTNRYRRAGQKESCRLKTNPMIDAETN
jgi:type II secretory pathway pseudopilin PulG